jgi:hypothetical protein
MKINLPAKLILSTAILVLVGCESTGTIQGVSEGQNVSFEYTQGLLENDGTLKITMPSGETYRGKFVQSSSSTSGNDWEIGESSNDDSFTLNDSKTVSSQTKAVLIGSRGNTMNCNFQLSNPDFGIDDGGIGSCKTSIGKLISISF